ncbi:acyltransferase [bacterium]|nr:acyltransferase [bacterium]
MLRGLACASVMLFHYLSRGPRAGWMDGAFLPLADAIAAYGYLGVHLFFMISGFVILMSAQGATPRSFIASRAARLYPAFWISASITTVAVWLAGDARFAVSLPDYLVNLTMFASWFGTQFIDGAYWSLAVEMLFYIYVWLALRFGLFDHIEWLLAAWLVVSAVNALRPMWPVEFWLNARWAPFFVTGSVFFMVRMHGVTALRTGLLLVAYVLSLFYALAEAARSDAISGYEPLLSGVIVVAVSGFFAVFAAIAFKRWTVAYSPMVAWLGVLTYPVYLLHQNLGYVVYGHLNGETGYPLFSLVLTTALVIALAWGVHMGFEKKIGPRLKRLILPG